MTDHLAVLEELAKEMRYRAGDCYDLSPIDADSWADRITAAIALMREQSWEWEKVGVLDGYGRITGDPKIRMIERRLEPGTLLYRFIQPKDPADEQ